MRMNGKKVEIRKVVCIKMHALVKKNLCYSRLSCSSTSNVLFLCISNLEHSKTTVSFSVGFSSLIANNLFEFETSSLQFNSIFIILKYYIFFTIIELNKCIQMAKNEIFKIQIHLSELEFGIGLSKLRILVFLHI